MASMFLRNARYRRTAFLLLLTGVLFAMIIRWRRAEQPADQPLDGQLTIVYPFEASVFPADMAAPTFRWNDSSAKVDQWMIRVGFANQETITRQDLKEPPFKTSVPQWTPDTETWRHIKQNSVSTPATVTIFGQCRNKQDKAISKAQVSFSTSPDEVQAPLFYREVNLPFRTAIKDPAAHIRWRFGTVASRERPRVVLEKMPLCGNCHSFSADGNLLGMDVDFGRDKGSYVICPVTNDMVFDNEKIISWRDFNRDENRGTFGLLSQVSPDGRYVISTVRDWAVFIPIDEIAFSQLFFPVRGILAFFDRKTRNFHALAGADDERYVQTNPCWSPDGKYIVFARAKVYSNEKLKGRGPGLLAEKDVPEFFHGGKPVREGQVFQFDLWRVPFNGGEGGPAEPLPGASSNGMSNFFPRYSPDGKWIVFCQAKNFMLLQPDSQLCIIPAVGGEVRRLQCNTTRMNSWHSWSPNSKWLVFSSKLFSDYTQLFLTHVDVNGRTTPPVVLSWFTSEDRAANIPEFVNTTDDAITRISTAFIDDEAYLLAGRDLVESGDYRLATAAFEKAVEINPDNADAHQALGEALMYQGKLELAKHQLEQALALEPKHAQALGALGALYLSLGQIDSARQHLRAMVEVLPDDQRAYALLAQSYVVEERFTDAIAMYRQAIARQPESVTLLLDLANIYLSASDRKEQNVIEAERMASKACRLTAYRDPSALLILSDALDASGKLPEAISRAEEALKLAVGNSNNELLRDIHETIVRLRSKLTADQESARQR